MTTVHDVIGSVCEFIDQMATANGISIDEARDKAQRGEFGAKGRLAHEIWYAWKYDGIDGGAADRWASDKKTYDVTLAENRASGREDWAGTVEAHDPESAMVEAKARFECPTTCRLIVSEVTADPEFTIGDHVEGGNNPEDYDHGYVEEIDGDKITVRWMQSMVSTTQRASTLRPYRS
jgi:hypothetical protein